MPRAKQVPKLGAREWVGIRGEGVIQGDPQGGGGFQGRWWTLQNWGWQRGFPDPPRSSASPHPRILPRILPVSIWGARGALLTARGRQGAGEERKNPPIAWADCVGRRPAVSPPPFPAAAPARSPRRAQSRVALPGGGGAAGTDK